MIKADPNSDAIEKIRNLKKSGKLGLLKMNWQDQLHIEKLDIDDKEPLRVEQESFLQAVADKTSRREVSVEEGWADPDCARTELKEPECRRVVEILKDDPKPDRGLKSLLARLEELSDYGFFDLAESLEAV